MSMKDWPQKTLEEFIRAFKPHQFKQTEFPSFEDLDEALKEIYPTKESWDFRVKQSQNFEKKRDWFEMNQPLYAALLQIDLNSAKDFLLKEEEFSDLFFHSTKSSEEVPDVSVNDTSSLISELVGASSLLPKTVTKTDFFSSQNPRFGTQNPEQFLPNFWYEQIRTNADAYNAAKFFCQTYSLSDENAPTWCFQRYGMTATLMPNRDWILIAGEHEDGYDDDFWIYNDVTVFSAKGVVKHFIYPREIFPPTDFHTATLIGEDIFIIGNLGYPEDRADTLQIPVFKLNTITYEISKVHISGLSPERIHRHSAIRDGNQILISGGKKATVNEISDNSGVWVLDTKALTWAPFV